MFLSRLFSLRRSGQQQPAVQNKVAESRQSVTLNSSSNNSLLRNSYRTRYFSSNDRDKGKKLERNLSIQIPQPVQKNYVQWSEMQIFNPSDLLEMHADKFLQPKIRWEDESATVELKEPKSFTEDKKGAVNLGFNQYFKHVGYGAERSSSIGVTFHPRSKPSIYIDSTSTEQQQQPNTIETFVEKQKFVFFQELPMGTINEVQLSATLTDHLKKNNIRFQTLIFNDHRDLLSQIVHPPKLQNSSRMTLFLQTPGGFWEFAYFNRASQLLHNAVQKELFADMVKNIMITFKPEPVPKTAEALASEDKTEMLADQEVPESESDGSSIGAKIALQTAHSVRKKLAADGKKRKRPSPTRTETNTNTDSNESI